MERGVFSAGESKFGVSTGAGNAHLHATSRGLVVRTNSEHLMKIVGDVHWLCRRGLGLGLRVLY